MSQGFILSRPNWVALSPLLASILLLPIVWWGLAVEWLSGEQDNAHALPAALAALYVLLSSNVSHHRTPKYWDILIFSAVVFSIFASVITQLINIDQASYALMVVVSVLLLSRGLNRETLHTHLIVAFLLALSIPVWDVLLEPLVFIASEVVTWLVGLMNMTVLIEGNSITTPYGRILIAEGCSGIRYFMVALVLGAVLAHMNRYRLIGTVLAIAFFAMIGLIANWLRILLLVIIGYQSEMQSDLMHDHELFGWVIYALFILPAIYFAPKHAAPNQNKTNRKPDPMFWSIILILAISANGALAFYGSINRGDSDITALVLPQEWTKTERPDSLTSLPIQSQEAMTWHHLNNTSVYLGHFSNAKAGRQDKLVPYIGQSLVSDRWFPEQTRQIDSDSNTFMSQVLKSQISGQRYLRLQLFQVGNTWTDSYTTAKLNQIPALLTGTNSFNYFLLFAKCKTPECTIAQQELNDALAILEVNR